MKKQIIIVFTAVILALSGCTKKENQTTKGNIITEGKNETQTPKPGENIPISRALAAKMLALAFSTTEEIVNMDNEIDFLDIDNNAWYYPYINRVCFLGLMRGTDKGFLPDEPLSLRQVQIILEDISNKKVEANKANLDKPVSLSLWTELFYEAIKEKTDELGIKVEETAIFATAEKGNMPSWSVATEKGVLKCNGYAIDAYVDKTVKTLIKGNEIMGILSIEKDYGQFKNVYIKNNDNKSMEIFYEGGNRTFNYANTVDMPIADVEIKNGEIINILPTETSFRDTVKLIDNKKVSLEEKGELKLSEDFKVYDVNDGVVFKEKSALICGTNIGKLYIKDNVVCAAVIDQNAALKDLRVVIGTTGFSGYVHKNADITSDSLLSVKSGEDLTEVKKINLPQDDKKYFGENSRIYVYAQKEKPIEISSIERNWQGLYPQYNGVIEIEKREDGYVIVNEIDMETYLAAVVPSEMPSSYGLEASKVQAICARSYAYNQFFTNKFHEYGANIDDSVMSQVYNNIPANDISKKAVKETEGMYLQHNDEVISANFFSTSCGSFANSGEVWSKGNMFPSESKEYLKAHNETNENLSDEESMRNFIFSDNTGYDGWSEWSRWEVTMNQKQLMYTIENNLQKAYLSSPNLVKTLQDNYEFKSRPIEPLGKIIDIKVLKRGAGGNIMGLKIEGDKNTILLRTEYIIRTVLRPVGENEPVETTLKNGRKINNYSLMPSAYFIMETESDEEGFIKQITLIGGGNGHGVGMSQNGVKKMAEEGKTYKEILSYYYKGTEVIAKNTSK